LKKGKKEEKERERRESCWYEKEERKEDCFYNLLDCPEKNINR